MTNLEPNTFWRNWFTSTYHTHHLVINLSGCLTPAVCVCAEGLALSRHRCLHWRMVKIWKKSQNILYLEGTQMFEIVTEKLHHLNDCLSVEFRSSLYVFFSIKACHNGSYHRRSSDGSNKGPSICEEPIKSPVENCKPSVNDIRYVLNSVWCSLLLPQTLPLSSVIGNCPLTYLLNLIIRNLPTSTPTFE